MSGELWSCPPCCRGVSCWGNQQRDVDVAFSICKYQFLKRGILHQAFIKLSQRVEEKEEKEPAVKQPGSRARWQRCGTQHQLIPTGSKRPFKASKLLTRPSPPRAGLSPGCATGWHTAQSTRCIPARRLHKLCRVFLVSSECDALKAGGWSRFAGRMGALVFRGLRASLQEG